MDDDLTFIDTTALLDELERRYDAFVFAGYKDRDDTTALEDVRHSGNFHLCMGLAQVAGDRALSMWKGKAWIPDQEREDT